jgi:hypothetical protein
MGVGLCWHLLLFYLFNFDRICKSITN